MTTNTPAPITLRINDTCSVLGIGRSAVYKLIAEGRLRAIKIAGRTLVPRSEIERLVADVIGDPPSS